MARKDFGPTYDISGIEQPHSMQAEQSVLGSALLDPASLDSIVQLLRAEMFYVRQNRAVFEEMLNLLAASAPIDAIILADRLAGSEAFPGPEEVKSYLLELAETVPSLSNLPHYTELVYEKYIKRLLIRHAQEILEQSSDSMDSKMMLESAEQKLYEIRAGRDTSTVQVLKNAIIDIMAHLQLLSGPNRKDYLGIPTGYSQLDQSLTGLGRSDLLILAARPGMGKTSFALNIAVNVARTKVPVMIFSLEMNKEQLAGRILSSEALVDSHLFRTGLLKDKDWEDLVQISEVLGPLPMYLDDTAAITIPEMKSKIRRINRSAVSSGNKPVGLIVIDYLQLMSTGRRSENRVQEISEITRNLKIMAKDLNVPIMALSQLSRSAEKGRPDKRPMLSDLRDSGSIEQDADVVLFLYREDYYSSAELDADVGSAECIIAKNRHGETTTIHMRWDAAHTRFLEEARSD